jgi:RNA polymerase sigma-70 factor (ECF subfamily)
MATENNDQVRLIVSELKAGSKNAFHLLFNMYAPKIHSFAFSYLKNKDDAEELLQEIFLKLWEIRSTLDDEKNIKSLLFKICINLIYDFIRRKNIEKAYLVFAGHNDLSIADSTWHEVVYHDMLLNLNKLVETMPEQRKLIFRLSKEEGLTNDEIAARLQLSKRTVENQLYRAISFLRERIGQSSLPILLFFFLQCN